LERGFAPTTTCTKVLSVSKAVDVLSVLLLVLAVLAFVAGIYALGNREDVRALYFLVVGALCLRSSTEMLRPRSRSRG
jgi:hypothetical protein